MKTAVRIALIALALLLLAAGVHIGEHRKTEQNAIYLCLDCIGIGR